MRGVFHGNKYRNKWINFRRSAAQKKKIPKFIPTEHCWYNREREVAGVRCRQFGTVRLKFKLSTYIQEPFL